MICGGIGRIGNVAEKLMPAASGIYIVFSLVVILSCADASPGPGCGDQRRIHPVGGGGRSAGYGISRSLRYGMARGVFSNEAGLGTLAVLHGAGGHHAPETGDVGDVRGVLLTRWYPLHADGPGDPVHDWRGAGAGAVRGGGIGLLVL